MAGPLPRDILGDLSEPPPADVLRTLQADNHYTGKFGPVAIVCDVEVRDGVVVGYVTRADIQYGCNGQCLYVLPPTTDEKAA